MDSGNSLKRVVVFIVVLLVCTELTSAWGRRRRSRKSKSKTTVDVGVKANNKGHEANVGVKHKGDGWSGGVSGSVDSNGNWGVKAGISVELGKRSINWNGKHYSITFTVDQCNFNVYDANGDGYITEIDIQSIFGVGKQAENFFNDLNLTTDDDKVDEQEFNYMAPLTIKGCEDPEIPNSA